MGNLQQVGRVAPYAIVTRKMNKQTHRLKGAGQASGPTCKRASKKAGQPNSQPIMSLMSLLPPLGITSTVTATAVDVVVVVAVDAAVCLFCVRGMHVHSFGCATTEHVKHLNIC